MTFSGENITIPDELVISKIYLIRNKKVMIDSDLAELFEVETKVLKQAVKRNIDLFPQHFMFEITEEECKNLRSQTVTSSWGGQRYPHFVFSEHGVLQLANVLRSNRARKMSIRIIEVFIKMRELLSTHIEILQKLEQLEKNEIEQDKKIILIFEYLKQLEKTKQQELKQNSRARIGFKQNQ